MVKYKAKSRDSTFQDPDLSEEETRRFRGPNRKPKVTREHTLRKQREYTKRWSTQKENLSEGQKRYHAKTKLNGEIFKNAELAYQNVSAAYTKIEKL